ncbi:hypothetical protein JXA85_07230 [Candidatus Woesearchaeota archaeon]|nr:hypothetical protein [Candidatus Woesearchaeota archaeon]
MIDYSDDARSELKRADHLIYVSLKYTRTVDVFQSIIERLINAIGFVIDDLIKKAMDEGKINSVPVSPKLKCEAVKQSFNDEKIKEYLDFYIMLRKITRSEFSKSNEFRRHVTMTVRFDTGEVLEVNIDKIHEYYDYTKQIVDYCLNEKKEEE